ncbi:MAG TPA: DUF11 domain-containing protein [Phycisphaerae bacterium]|nr:DUF11 domain-containing protein [Phycisphaerae bacterium]
MKAAQGIGRNLNRAVFALLLIAGFASQAQAQLVITVDEDDEFVKYIDVATLIETDLFKPLDSVVGGAGGDGPEGIAADDANRLFYWQDNNNLYRTPYDDTDANGFMISTKIADIRCTTCTGDTDVDGLTFANGVLYAVRNTSGATTGPEGLYSINVTNGVATLLATWSSNDVDVRDIAYDPASGLFYIYNNDPTNGFGGGGAGIYSLDIDNVLNGGAFATAMVQSVPTITDICPSDCGTNTAHDIDGMALGDGKIYLNVDQEGPTLVFDIATDQFESDMANPWTTTELGAGGTWAPSALEGAGGVADLSTNITAESNAANVPDGGDVEEGNDIVYSINYENLGAEIADSMSYEIIFSGDATFNIVSATGQLSTPSINGNTITGGLTPFNVNAPEVITVTVNASFRGTLNAASTIAISGQFPDEAPLNNSASHTTNIFVEPADLTVSLSATSQGSPVINDGNVGVGEQVVYTLTNGNLGPENAENMSYEITFSGTATFSIASAVGEASTPNVAGDTVSGEIEPFTVGAVETVTITVNALTAGTLSAAATISTDGEPPDTVPGNNSAAHTAEVKVFPAVETVVFAEDSIEDGGTGNSSVIPAHPTLGGSYTVQPLTSFFSRVIYPPYRSPDGRYIGFVITVVEAENFNHISVFGEDGVFSVVAQQGVTMTTNPTDTLDEMILHPRIIPNNDGHFAFNASFLGSPRGIVQWNGAGFTTLARTDQVIPAFGALNYRYGDSSVSWDSVNFDGSGRFGTILDFITNATSGQDNVILSHSGQMLLAQSSVTGPLGTAETWDNAFLDDTYWFDGAGLEWIAAGEINGAAAVDKVVVVNNEIVLQEDDVIPGLSNPISTFAYAHMISNGDWYAYGSNDGDAEDWLVRGNGAAYSLLAKAGDPIYPGAGDSWDDAEGFGAGYLFVAANNQGDYIICGRTNRANTRKNTVCVLNGTTEVLREGDPIDVNDNGLFDDNRYVRTFDLHTAILTDGGDFYCTVDMTDSTLTGASGPIVGRATVRVPVSVAPLATGADIAVAKTGSSTKLASLGEEMTYSVEVCNRGPDDATNVLLTDNLPAEFDFISGTNGIVESPSGSGMLSASIASLPAYQCVEFEITVAAAAEGAAVVNSASASTNNQVDPKPGNNTGSAAAVLIDEEADLEVTKIDDGGAPPNGLFTYTVTITNHGPAPADNVVMTDTLPAGVVFDSATNGATEAGGVVTANFANIGVGLSEVVEITVSAAAENLYINNVSVASADTDPDPVNNSASFESIVAFGYDVSVTKSGISAAAAGEQVIYEITVSNAGPNTATNIVVTDTLPAGFTLSSVSVPHTEIGPGVIEMTFPQLLKQTSETIQIVGDFSVNGVYTNTVSVVADEAGSVVDLDPDNNSASFETIIGDFRPIKAIYTEIDGDPTSIVPGALDLNGDPQVTEFKAIEEFAISDDSSQWVVKGRSEAGAEVEEILILGSGFSGDNFAQAGQPVPGVPGELYDFFSASPRPASFDSSGNFIYQARTNGAAATDAKYIVFDPTLMTHTILLQEGDSLTGLFDVSAPSGDEFRSTSTGSIFLRDDGQAWNVPNPIGACSSFRYPALLVNDASFRQSGVSLIQGFTWDLFDMNGAGGTLDGLHWFAEGEIEEGATTNDRILAVDDVIVAREGFTIDGSALNVADITGMTMRPNGDWFARGTYPNGADWAVVNGVRVAETGDPITVGSGETIGDTMNGFTGNQVGDWILSCNTSEPDDEFDTVLLLNDETVIAREGDPVDVDGNGFFDDGAFIGRSIFTTNPFAVDDLFIDDNRVVHFIASLRDSEGQDLGVFGSSGDAFLRVDLSTPAACPTIQGDANGDAARNGVDVQAFVDCFLTGGVPAGSCVCVDYDADDDLDGDDVNAFATQLVTDP